MPRPGVHDTTEDWYDRLPEFYRSADAEEDFPLLRYLSLLGDQVGEVVDLFERVNYRTPDEGGTAGDTSDLVDPTVADAAWLPWLAQLVGVELPDNLTTQERRDAIATAGAGWRAGTKKAIAEAAKTELTGTRYVEVIDHYEGSPWKIGVRTRQDETVDVNAVVEAILRLKAKPAGALIVTAFYAASWQTIETTYPTWGDLEAAGSWSAIESTQP